MDDKSSYFSLPPDLHYLNCAYMSPLPRVVENAGISGMQRKRNPTTISQEDFFEESQRAKQLFAQLINAPSAERIAIIPAVSYGIATAVQNLSPPPGSRIVVAEHQFPSNVYGWLGMEDRLDISVNFVAPPSTIRNRGRNWNRRLLDAIDHNTSIVALPHVHWADGTRFDLDAISEKTRTVDAALIVDGTQSVGALPFNTTQIKPDALVCAGYKWLLGPYSLGFAYYGPRFDGGTPLEETWIARDSSQNFKNLTNYVRSYRPGAVRYDVGERSNFILLPMLIKAMELLLEWQVPNIQRYCKNLIQPALEPLRANGWRFEEKPYRTGHLFGLRPTSDVDPAEIERQLDKHRVSISRRGDVIRVSPNVYNDKDDIDALIRALTGN